MGPLRADARATAGIYLMFDSGQRALEGFMHAVGEGHLACFGVGVNIEIRMTQQDGGAMAGSSLYEYSFKVGFFKVRFRVQAGHRQENGSGRSTAAVKAAPGAGAALVTHPLTPAAAPVRRTQTVLRRKDKHWNQYRRHLDI
jgi:hypothetical protein